MSKKRRSNFKSKVRKDANRQKKEAKSYGYLNLPKDVSVFNADPGGRARLDFIPYNVTDKNHPDRDDDAEIATPDTLWYKRPFYIHRNIGVDDETVVCLRSVGKKCPICEYRKKRIGEGADREETDELRSKLRNLYAVIPLNNKDHDEEIHIWDISQHLFQNLLNEELEEDEDNACFPELEGGKTVKVRFDDRSIGKGASFADANRIDFLDRKEDYDETILDDVPNLDEILQVKSYKELESMFMELDAEDTLDDDEELENEDEAPKERKRKKTHKKPKDEDKEDNEPEEKEDDEEKEEKEEKKPKRTRSKKPSKKDDKNKCPEGYTFGKDCDAYDECASCEVWDECSEKQEELEDE